MRGACGCIIDDSSISRRGRRYENNENDSEIYRQVGGKRIKKSQDDYLQFLKRRSDEVHQDASLHWEEQMNKSASLANNENDENPDGTDNDEIMILKKIVKVKCNKIDDVKIL